MGQRKKAFELMLMMLACFWVRVWKVFELMLMMLACLWAIGKRLRADAHDAGLFVGPCAEGFRADAHDAGLFVGHRKEAFELMLMMLACLWAIGKRLSS